MLLTGQRHLFDVPDEVVYVNTANLSPLLHSVHDAGRRGLDMRGRPWTITAPDWFRDVEALRDPAARLLQTSADHVALVPATSYGLAIAARNLPLDPGDRVLVLAEEYPSNYYTWQRATQLAGAELVVISREPGQDWASAILDRLDDQTAVVAVPNVHWTDGALVDLDAIAPRVRDAGAALVIDASQSLGAMQLDLPSLQPAFVVAVGYKWLLGPFSVGYLYVADQHLDGPPLEENWILRDGSEDFAALVDYTDQYLPGARRYDVGQRTNFGLVPMAIAALDQLLAWGVPNIAHTLEAVTGQITDRAASLGLPAPPRHTRGPHMLGLPIPPGTGTRLLNVLHDAGVSASVLGSALRLSPHLHTTEDDIDRLATALGADPLTARTGRRACFPGCLAARRRSRVEPLLAASRAHVRTQIWLLARRNRRTRDRFRVRSPWRARLRT